MTQKRQLGQLEHQIGNPLVAEMTPKTGQRVGCVVAEGVPGPKTIGGGGWCSDTPPCQPAVTPAPTPLTPPVPLSEVGVPARSAASPLLLSTRTSLSVVGMGSVSALDLLFSLHGGLNLASLRFAPAVGMGLWLIGLCGASGEFFPFPLGLGFTKGSSAVPDQRNVGAPGEVCSLRPMRSCSDGAEGLEFDPSVPDVGSDGQSRGECKQQPTVVGSSPTVRPNVAVGPGTGDGSYPSPPVGKSERGPIREDRGPCVFGGRCGQDDPRTCSTCPQAPNDIRRGGY